MAIVKWVLDPAHSELQFKVKHLMITTVTGTFDNISLEMETEDDDILSAKNIQFSALVNSISTNNAQRDEHLRSHDFFDASNYPEISFTAANLVKDGDQLLLPGTLTMKGVSRVIPVKVKFGGIIKDPYGQIKAGFSIQGSIDRRDFGLTWSSVTDTGSIVVSDEVKYNGELQLVRQAAEK